MKIYNIKIYGKFQITGRGTIITVHRDENDVEGIDTNSFVMTNDDRKLYRVTGIECSKNNFGDGKNIGILVKEYKPEEFVINAVLDGKCYNHFGIEPSIASIYGDKPEDIVELKLKVSEDQNIPVPNGKYEKADYWGWLDATDEDFRMIYAQRFLLDICFLSGIKGTEDVGQGKAYRLEIIDK